jgi:hypothetical protein
MEEEQVMEDGLVFATPTNDMKEEIAIMEYIWGLLARLSPEKRKRVMDWVNAQLDELDRFREKSDD